MSLISVLEPVPSRVRALVRLVAAEGAMSREDLRSRMVPVGEGKQFDNLVRETIRLGLLSGEDGKVRLGAGIKVKDVVDDDSFVVITDRALLCEPLPEGDNRPVAFALAWLLSRQPGLDLEWNGEYTPLMLAEMEGDEVYDLTNASRCAMLAYWARFLGYAEGLQWGGKTLVVPDPTEAIARRLNAVFGHDATLPVALFFDRLATHCPVLEGGSVRIAIDARLRRKRERYALSPATSLALLRLEKRGLLKLETRSDAEVWLVDLMYEAPRRLSHMDLAR